MDANLVGPSPSTPAGVPLSGVAEDARALVEEFRRAGGLSFGSHPPALARERFARACAINASREPLSVRTEDLVVDIDGASIPIRLYQPASPGPTRTWCVFLHGGGWVIGDLDTHDSLCRLLAHHSGAWIVSVGYRCAPEHPFPGPLDDCARVIDRLLSHADTLGGLPDRLVVAGDSAGAGMATAIANGFVATEARIDGQILLYPVTDLTLAQPSHRDVTTGFGLVASSMRWFRDLYVPTGIDLRDARLSPLLHAQGRRQPPLFLVTVGLDPLRDEGIAYGAAASRAGTRVTHHHLPTHMHGIFTATGRVATARRLVAEAGRFIAEL